MMLRYLFEFVSFTPTRKDCQNILPFPLYRFVSTNYSMQNAADEGECSILTTKMNSSLQLLDNTADTKESGRQSFCTAKDIASSLS